MTDPTPAVPAVSAEREREEGCVVCGPRSLAGTCGRVDCPRREFGAADDARSVLITLFRAFEAKRIPTNLPGCPDVLGYDDMADWFLALLSRAPREEPGRRDALDAINKACRIIERGDQRLLAADGPCGGMPPDLTLAEWRELYVTLDNARKPTPTEARQ